jgi:ligand-binding sensor domain-containing protein
MPAMKFWSALLFLTPVFFSDAACAGLWPSWRSKVVDELHALENSTISSIYRKSNGDVLIATAEALYAFDGQSIKQLPVRWATNDGYPLDRVLGFLSSSDGSVWLYTVKDGIYFKAPKSDGFRLLPDVYGWSVGVQVAAAINIDKPIGMLSLSMGRAYFFDIKAEKAVRLGDTRDGASIVAIGTTPDGYITLIDSNGWLTYYAWHVNGGWIPQSSVYCSFETPPAGKISTLDGIHFMSASNERRIVSFRNEGTKCQQDQHHIIDNQGIQHTRVRDIWRLPETGYLALATDAGLLIHKDNSTELLNTGNSLLRSNQVTAITETSKGQILVGSYLGLVGAYRSDVRSITRLGNEGLPEVTSVSSSNGRVYVSTYRGLYQLDKVHSSYNASQIKLPKIQGGISVLEVIGSSLYVGMSSGMIIVLDTITSEVRCVATTEAMQPITGFTPSPSHDGIYVSVLSGDFFEIGPCGRSHHINASRVGSLHQTIIGFDTIGDEIVVTDFTGIQSISNDLFDQAFQPDSPSAVEFSSFHPGAWIFAASNSGFLFASPKGSLTFKESVRSNHVAQLRSISETPYSIEIDGSGRVWAASKKGLWIGSEDSDFRLAFRTEEMGSIAFEYGASHKTRDGTLVFGGVGGLVIIESPTSLPRRSLGKLSLRSATLQSKSYEATYPLYKFNLSAPSDNGVLSFSFLAPFEIGRNFYGVETMLSPIDSEWTRHEAMGPVEIGPLPPGTYTFRARGANALGVWSENEIVIPIRIYPSIWLSWWAFVLYGLAALLAVSFAKRFYLRHLAREARLAYGEEAARAFSRLEDDWQEQREATDRLLRSIPVSISTVIQTIRKVVASQAESAVSASDANDEALPPLLAKIDRHLQALQKQQDVCVLTTASQTCGAQQLINELVGLVAEKSQHGSRYIVLDETEELALDAGLGKTVAIIMMELLELMMYREPATDRIDPIITTCIERDGDALRITVADRDAVRPSETLVEKTLAATFTLLEDFGGSIVEEDDFGYEVEIKLPEPKSAS